MTYYNTPPLGEEAKIFFPVAGGRGANGEACNRGYNGFYWSSTPCNSYSHFLNIDGAPWCTIIGRANGASIRCVQE